MKRLYRTFIQWFEAISTEFIIAIARIAIAVVFLRFGLDGWSGEPAATGHVVAAAELVLPLLIFIGLLTRFAAFGLLILTIATAFFVVPSAIEIYGVWTVALLFLMKHGAGRVSLDQLIGSKMTPTHAMRVRSETGSARLI